MNYYDTDTNSHINNISYVNWACDAFPFSFHDSHRIKMFDCHWVKQTFDGDDVTVETYSDHDHTHRKKGRGWKPLFCIRG